MEHIEKSIEVGAPLRAVYNQWTQFEEFPRFMAGVKEVRQIDDTHVHWHANLWGRDMEWDAEITEHEPDRRISWMSLDGAWNAGTVGFERTAEDRTRVRLVMAYQSESETDKPDSVQRFLARRVESTLDAFKQLIEAHCPPLIRIERGSLD